MAVATTKAEEEEEEEGAGEEEEEEQEEQAVRKCPVVISRTMASGCVNVTDILLTVQRTKLFLHNNLTRQMECFPNLLDLCQVSIWERAEHLGKGRAIKKKI